MAKYVITWNANKTEGVIFRKNDADDDEAIGDAYHAGGGVRCNPCSSVGDYFRDTYGESQDCFIQHVDIDSSNSSKIEKDGE